MFGGDVLLTRPAPIATDADSITGITRTGWGILLTGTIPDGIICRYVRPADLRRQAVKRQAALNAPEPTTAAF